MGWLIGAVISPYDETEAKEFSSYIKVISTFLSGYALSKADQFFNNNLIKVTDVNVLVIIRVLILTSSFLIMMLITFYFRRYAFSVTASAAALTGRPPANKASATAPAQGGGT
jgi:hypothetical protein